MRLVLIYMEKNTSDSYLKNFCNIKAIDYEDKLNKFFENKKIYIEIFNGKDDISETFRERIKKHKAIIYKGLSKNIEYIVFQQGYLKTKRFASFNNIPLVNPLWIDDKISHGIFNPDADYIINVNYAEIVLCDRCKTKNADSLQAIKLPDDDEMDIKIDEYIDTKLKSYKSENKSINRNKDELYYPLFDLNLRRKKRTSNNNNMSNNINMNNDSILSLKTNIYTKPIKLYSTKNKLGKISKLNKNKSDNNLKKQTVIEFKDNKLTFNKRPIEKEKNLNAKSIITLSIFDSNNKIKLYTYNCNQNK